MHDGDWYVKFGFKEKNEYAAIVQLRNIDVSRLYDRIGQVPVSDLEKVQAGIIKLLFKKIEKKCAPNS